jgi:hypothetical protein
MRWPPPYWFEIGSEFWMDLATRLRSRNVDAEFRIFRWSGANSLSARLKAAQQLRDEIASIENTSLRTPCQLIVAHSHGGNIAVWAATEPRTSWGQTHRASPSDCFGVATMGTPFLHVRHRVTDWGQRSSLALLHIVTVAIIVWLAIQIVRALTTGFIASELVWPPTPPGNTVGWPEFKVAARSLPGLIIVCLLLGMFAAWNAMQRLRSISEPIHKYEIGTRKALFEARPVPGLLVLRAPGDEASVVLATTQVADLVLAPVWRGMRRILGIIATVLRGRRATWLTLLGALLVAPSATVLLRYFALGEPWSIATDSAIGRGLVPQVLDVGWVWIRPVLVAGVPLGVAMIAVFLVLGVALLLGGLALMPFGWEFFANGLLLEVTAEATPRGGTYAVETLQVEGPSRGLRHSLHDMEITRERLAAWIEARYAEWRAAQKGGAAV